MSRIIGVLSTGLVVAALALGFTGCTDTPAKDKDKMKADEKMKADKMADDKMKADKMADDKMKADKMKMEK